jgi:enoyl-CoA hydratase
MILRGRKIDGAEAYRIGLVTELHPVAELKARAQVLAASAANRGSADSQEGMRAFLEKRKPVFNQSL